MTGAVKCECEHAHHFDSQASGHPYGARETTCAAYQTDSGMFILCHWCWDVCHHAVLPLAV